MSASYIPTSPRKRKRRPPVSPSSSCEVCRSYYQEETQLDNELLSVLKDFEWQMRVQANDMQSLQHTQQVWDQKPPSGLSPDIQHLHYHRKHEVLGMLHTAYDEHAEKVKRWLEFHKNARQHQGSLATKPVPHGSPRLYMQCNVKRQRKGAKQRSTASDPEHRRRWFHQEGVDGLPEDTTVDVAEDCAMRAHSTHINRLKAESNVLASQLRLQLASNRAAHQKGAGRLATRERLLDAVESRVELEEVERAVPSTDTTCATDAEETVSTAALEMITTLKDDGVPSRARGDSEFWMSLMRAASIPSPQSIVKQLSSPKARKKWGQSGPKHVTIETPATMATQVGCTKPATHGRPPGATDLPSILSPAKLPMEPTKDEDTSKWVWPPDPLAGAAARLQAAQRSVMSDQRAGVDIMSPQSPFASRRASLHEMPV